MKVHLYDFCDGPLRDLNPASQLFIELLLVPSGQLRQERSGRIVLVILLRLVAGFGVEALEQDADVFVQLVPVPTKIKKYIKSKLKRKLADVINQ